uniref:Coiled-coil transcriptional coactivator a n=1 Tax=Salmo salar TaxID=8030 RepID=B3TDF0_SALSA|nr:coiled-coil transcriptional coactivator a [Salmo salar]
MEKAWRVEFRNVGSSYFPQSRVECHYSISSQHTWASHDWVGLFKVGWSSVKDYHTFVWALAPEGYQEGTDVNCCVNFQGTTSYLPKSSSQQYQFVYVDGKGEVCSASSQFTFSAPKPLEDLVTLEEGAHGEEGGTDMLLVVPRAELLQSRLQECLRERAELLHAREAAERMKEREREKYRRAREAWDRGCEELERNIADLKEELRESRDRMEEMERRQEEVEASGEALAQEKSSILTMKAASEQRIRELEDDIKALALKALERETELERMKERAKKQAVQRREEEKERKVLQAESEAALAEMRGLRERLGASERCAEGLKGELCALVAQRDQGQTELHQARLQAAQLTLQLADASLALREGRAHWAQERQSLQCSTEKARERLEKLNGETQRIEKKLQEERMEREKVEVELGREKDCNRVQLGETCRELQELKASLRVAQKEKEQLLLEQQARPPSLHPPFPLSHSPHTDTFLNQLLTPVHLGDDLMEYMGQVEQRREALADAKDMSRSLSRVGVVISQPAPLLLPRQSGGDTLTHSSESEEEGNTDQCGGHSSGEETALLLPETTDSVLRLSMALRDGRFEYRVVKEVECGGEEKRSV